MNIFFYRTNWALLLFLLYNDNWKSTLFCFNSWKDVPSGLQTGNAPIWIFHKKEKKGYFVYKLGRLGVDIFRGVSFILYMKLRRRKGKFRFWGDDDSCLSKCFVDSEFCVVEDGLANYTPDTIVQLHKMGVVGLGADYIPMGSDPTIHHVLLSGSFKIPALIKNKAICVDVLAAWKRKSKQQKKDILSVFGTSESELRKYTQKIILLTQNFTSYQMERDINEYEVYRKILDHYPKKSVLIKPHPASQLDYSKLFSGYTILEGRFPFELLALYHKFDRVISINSTAAFTVPNYDYADIYDAEGRLYRSFRGMGREEIEPDEIRHMTPAFKGIKMGSRIHRMGKRFINDVFRNLFWSVK